MQIIMEDREHVGTVIICREGNERVVAKAVVGDAEIRVTEVFYEELRHDAAGDDSWQPLPPERVTRFGERVMQVLLGKVITEG